MSKTAEAVVDPKQALGSSTFKDLKLEVLIESRQNPRKDFDATSMSELIESVKRYGVLTPLIVRPVGNAGKYEVLAGARRSRAAKEAGLEVVPCRIVEVENDTALEVVVVENLQRKDIHPLEEAEGFREILALSNGDLEGLCVKTGKKAPFVTKRLSLLALIDKGRKPFLQGKITEQQAMMISRLQVPDQKAALDYVLEEEVSLSALRDWIETEVMRDLSKTPWNKEDAKLVPKAGPCTTCPKRTSVSKDLFSDIKQGDRCTDGACFKLKMKAHIEQIQRSLEASGSKVYGLWESYHGEKKPEGTLKVGDWVEIKKRDFCEKAAKGIYLEGQQAGHHIDICADREHCKIHGSIGLHGKDPAEREKTRKLNLKNKIERETRVRILKAVFEKQTLFDIEGLKILCLHSFDRLWHAAKINLVKSIGWELKKRKDYGGYDFANVEKRIKGFKKPEEADSFLMAVTCAGELDVNYHDPKNIDHFAAESKIDVKAIRSVVETELAKKIAKMPKTKKAKASKKSAKQGAKPPAEQQATASGEEE